MTKLKVLVTGGSGIVGHYVIDELYKQGHTVLNADKVRLTGDLRHSGTTDRYASASAAIALRDNWPRIPEFFEVDVTDYGQVISAMDDCDAVIALASRPSASYYVEEDVVRTNTMSMWNVCRAAEQLKINRLVLGSSYNAIGAMGTAQRWEANRGASRSAIRDHDRPVLVNILAQMEHRDRCDDSPKLTPTFREQHYRPLDRS